jgi:hypothetical protein
MLVEVKVHRDTGIPKKVVHEVGRRGGMCQQLSIDGR